MMKNEHERSIKNLNRHLHEAIALSQLENATNVVHFLGRCNYDIITEWMPVDLDVLLFERKAVQLSFGQVLQMALDMAKGVEALHSIPGPLVHSDIKPKQFLVDYDGTVKINDFNRGRFIQRNGYGERCKFHFERNTGRWRSPEEYLERPLDEKIDIYSLGLCFWTLLSRRRPYEELDLIDIYKLISEGQRPPFEPHWSEEFCSLIGTCWHQNSTQRPDASQVVKALQDMIQRHGNLPKRYKPTDH